MPDTILNPKLNLNPDKTKTLVFLKGEIAVLPDGAAYPAGLVKILCKKITFSVKPTFVKIKGPSAAGAYITTVRSQLTEVERGVKFEMDEVRSAAVATLFNSGAIHGKVKVWVTDYLDPSTTAAFRTDEFVGTVSLDGDLGGAQGEQGSSTSGAIEPDGDIVLVPDGATT